LPAASETPPSALEDWPRLAERFRGRRPVVFLDFDGTLSPVVEHHGDAVILPAAKRAVEELARRLPVIIVSGRDRRDVARRVGLPHLWYAGSHGFDIAGPDDSASAGAGSAQHRHEPQPELAPLIEAAADELRRALDGVPGAVVEAKRFAVSVHYRQVADDDLGRVDDAVARVVAAEPRLARSAAKKVYEVRPALDWDKGDALLYLLRQPELLGRDGGGDGEGDGEDLPLYIGDDLTDEDAFRAIDERPGGGVTIHVVDGSTDFETRADWSLASPQEVSELLRRLARLA